MRRYRFSIVSGAVLILASVPLALSLAPVQADDRKTLLRTGDYHDLDFWENVRLTTASVVDPDEYSKSAVVYVYDPALLLKASPPPGDILQQMEAGKLAIAEYSSGTYVVGSKSREMIDALKADLTAADPVATSAATIEAYLSQGNVVLVALDQKELGLGEAKGKLVSWKPGALTCDPCSTADPNKEGSN